MWFKLQICKRGRKCSQCKEEIKKDARFFLFTDYHEGMKFPINENWCLDCAKLVTNKEFLVYLSELTNAIHRARRFLNNNDFAY